jgi:hypothetical protein
MADDDMTVLPVKADDDVYQTPRQFHDILDRPPFVKLMIGSRGTGKTSHLVNEMMLQSMYGDRKGEEPVFEDIIIYSSTLGCESTARHLVDRATQTYSTYDNASIDALLEYQKSKPKEERRHICVIADDIGPMLKREDSIFKLTSVHRHYLISIYFLIQSPRMIPPVVRNCYTSAYLYRLPNQGELEKAFLDFSFLGDRKDVEAMYKTATPKPYQCLVVDAVKNRVWKWGACPPELLWEKFTADGGYSARFSDKKSSSDSVDSDGEC